MSNSADKAFNAFTHDKRFVKGELYLLVIDISKHDQGIIVAEGQEKSLIWQDLYNLRDTYGTYIVRAIIDKAKQGGGWVTYQWRNATKDSYVKQVKKGNKTYVIGAGYYPHSKPDAVVNLVKSAVSLFNQVKAAGHPKDEAFSTISYPLGRFVYGDLYLYALDFNGTVYAHGDLPGLIGVNDWNYKDATGKYVNQEIISKLKNSEFGSGIWMDYMSKNAPKRAYAEKVVDSQGKLFFIACGYYPTADRAQVIELVKKGYVYMKGNGRSAATKAFSDKRSNTFRYGDLYLFVYDLKGLTIAHGGIQNSWEKISIISKTMMAIITFVKLLRKQNRAVVGPIIKLRIHFFLPTWRR